MHDSLARLWVRLLSLTAPSRALLVDRPRAFRLALCLIAACLLTTALYTHLSSTSTLVHELALSPLTKVQMALRISNGHTSPSSLLYGILKRCSRPAQHPRTSHSHAQRHHFTFHLSSLSSARHLGHQSGRDRYGVAAYHGRSCLRGFRPCCFRHDAGFSGPASSQGGIWR